MIASSLSRWFGRLALCGLLALGGCGAQIELFSNIAERDVNDVVAELLNRGITASKVAGKEGLASVQVAQADVARAIDILRVAGLPKEAFKAMGTVFTKDGLISSPLEERARYLYALSQELSGTLSNIDGVLFARVHLVLPERGTGLEKTSPSSAAVFIKHRSEFDIDILQPQVRRLVANSIPDLTVDRVSVVLISSTVKPPAPVEQVKVWGVQVPPGAAGSLRMLGWVMIVLLLAAVGAAGVLAYLYVRGRAPPATEPTEAA